MIKLFKRLKYKMSESYSVKKLVIGNLAYISSTPTMDGPKTITTEQKYIFEKLDVRGKTKYREVFTGYLAGDKPNYFDLPYIINIRPLYNEITVIKDKITKYTLLITMDEINNKKLDNMR